MLRKRVCLETVDKLTVNDISTERVQVDDVHVSNFLIMDLENTDTISFQIFIFIFLFMIWLIDFACLISIFKAS